MPTFHADVAATCLRQAFLAELLIFFPPVSTLALPKAQILFAQTGKKVSIDQRHTPYDNSNLF